MSETVAGSAVDRDRRTRLAADAKTPCITSSFQAEYVVLMHMSARSKPDIPVLFLETFHHFPQTLDLPRRDRREVETEPDQPEGARAEVGLWQTSTDDCCARHKVGPLFAALEGYDTWFTALRRDQSPSRANLQHVEPFTLTSGKVLRKVSPLAAWTTRTCGGTPRSTTSRCCRSTSWATRASAASPAPRCPLDPSNPRSGRWQGQKLECGIHIEPTK